MPIPHHLVLPEICEARERAAFLFLFREVCLARMILSTAKYFFTSLIDQGADAFAIVSDLVTAEAEENDWREFKGASFLHPDLAAPDPEVRKDQNHTIKKYWSQNISAFANSGGGLLIWGIETKKNRAHVQSLASSADTLRDRLEQLKMEATDPPVLGVETLAVLEPGSPSGYVVCYIPGSDYSPHRATLSDGGFFIRAGDSTQPMKTEILRRMFYPQLSHRLTPIVTLRLQERQTLNDRWEIHTSVVINNRGNASAQETIVVLSSPVGAKLHRETTRWEAGLQAEKLKALETIHPGDAVPLVRNWTSNPFRSGELPPDISYTFTVMALNSVLQKFRVTFTSAEVVASQDAPCTKDAQALNAPPL